MSCCVKSSVLRRLAEQKGQKSMLIKGCGQLLACGFALIKLKCSCSQKTLLIYSSNSEHWLWVRPVGFVAFRALTKKSQHFLQRYEVCMCAYIYTWVCLLHVRARWCLCAYVSLWQVHAIGCFFPQLCQKHVAWSNTPVSHGVKSLHSPWASPWLTRFIPYLAENSFITKNNLQSFPRCISILSLYAEKNKTKNTQTSFVYNYYYFFG